MSNLYKQPFVVCKADKTRVIDSNEMVARKLQELQKLKEEPQQGTPDASGFTAGLGAPVVEVEPEIDYVAEAKQQAEELLQDARRQADSMRQEAELESGGIREAAKEEGWQNGYADGTARANEELSAKTAELEKKRQELILKYEEKQKDMEPQLLDAVIHVVEKVFHIQFDDKKEILLYLLTNAIHGIEGCRKFQIRVGRDNYQFVDSHRHEIIERVGGDVSVEVIADNVIAEDKCMIETEVGVFDCSLGVQLENLIKDLRSLCS